MAATKENSPQKSKGKQNADEHFESPEKLTHAARQYFEWCDNHPLYRQEAVKSGSECGRIIDIPIRRPYSLGGLCVYLQCSQSKLARFGKNCDDAFKETIETIENIIETQQFEGAAAGIFNTSIIARKLGLREQTDITSNGQSAFTVEVIDKKTKQQLEALKSKLNRKS